MILYITLYSLKNTEIAITVMNDILKYNMQDQLQFTIGYTWVKMLSRDINLLLFVKMYCKTFI